MNARNSLKITGNQFNLVFKVLLYDIIVFLIIGAIAAGILIPEISHLLDEIRAVGIWEKFMDVVNAVLAGEIGEGLVDTMYSGIDEAVAILRDNYWILTQAYIIGVIMLVLFRFLYGLRSITVSDILSSHMSANTKFGFVSNLISNLGKASKFSFASLAVNLPLDAIIILALYFITGPLFGLIGIFAPTVFVAFIVALLAFKDTLLFGWLPAIVVGKMKIWQGFAYSVRNAFKKFGDVFGMMVLYRVLSLCFAAAMLFFTMGLGVFIALPICYILLRAFELTYYYDAHNLRYYSDGNDIVVPDKDIDD